MAGFSGQRQTRNAPEIERAFKGMSQWLRSLGISSKTVLKDEKTLNISTCAVRLVKHLAVLPLEEATRVAAQTKDHISM